MCQMCMRMRGRLDFRDASATNAGDGAAAAAADVGRIWWPEATRLEDPSDISNGTWTPKSSGERDGVLVLA
jgi:hypothetical protein